MIPPNSMKFVGLGDFEEIGREFQNYFVNFGGLQPTDRVLDVGCGIGRMAVPLTSYLSPQGEYIGFDLLRKGIDWCKSRITPNFSNFSFQQVDLYNNHYNPNGKTLAKDYQFPFDDGFFDFVFLTSVFTHMLPEDLENYLGQISRVLRPGGKCLITFFILNEESENLMRLGKSTFDFRYKFSDDCSSAEETDPEAALGYQERFVDGLFRENGLNIVQPIHYGSWCGRDTYLSYQDLIIATKSSLNR